MVNVEADVLCGALLAARARAKNLVYSMAYGDQPAIICELVDWVRSCGFELTSAGKGMNFEPRYRYSTPDTVWSFFGWTEEEVAKGDFNPKMYNSFTDGTKAAIEMAAVANGTGLDCPDDGLAFPPTGLHDLAGVFKPVSDGGRLPRSGLVDIAASQEPDGREVFNNIRYGVFVTFKANNEYTRDCFKQYGLLVDKSGWYGSMWRPFHLIGLETSVSVLSAVLRNEPTGTPTEFRGDAVATAKRDLKAGEMLDGEGGYTVWANAIPATKSLAARALPIGLAHNVKLKRPVAKDTAVSFDDVELDRDLDVVELRREMERAEAPPGRREQGGSMILSQPGKPAAFVVIPEFVVKPDCIDAFLAFAHDDASHSLAAEPGCRQFDVVQRKGRLTKSFSTRCNGARRVHAKELWLSWPAVPRMYLSAPGPSWR